MVNHARLTRSATKAGKIFGLLLVNTALLCIKSTIIWALLDVFVGVEVAWQKVFGMFCIYTFLISTADD